MRELKTNITQISYKPPAAFFSRLAPLLRFGLVYLPASLSCSANGLVNYAEYWGFCSYCDGFVAVGFGVEVLFN